MQARLVLLLLALSAATAESQTPASTSPPAGSDVRAPPSQEQVTYFLVDASGSMKEEVEEASKKLAAKFVLLEPGSRKSVTFFGGKSPSSDGSGGCDAEIAVSKATSPETSAPQFPQLGSSDDKTAIGKVLEAVFFAGGDDASVVLITDGAEECGADFPSIRARYPNAEIEVLQVGNTPNAALRVLESKPTEQSANPAQVLPQPLPLPLPVTLVPPAADPEASWDVRLFWVILLALSALAGALFCLQSGERTKSLQDQLAQLEKKTIADPAASYKRTKQRKGKPVRRGDGERFSVYWIRDHENKVWQPYGAWAFICLGFAVLGWLALVFTELALLVLPEAFVRAVRVDSWRFLNSNIGSYSFAGTIIALVGFSAVQWWQTLEAKKQLLIRAGIIASERAGVAKRQYERARRAIQGIRFTLPSRLVYWFAPPEQVEISGFDILQAKLLDLAAPPFEEASATRQRDIQSFVNFRDPLSFAHLLQRDGQLKQHQVDAISRLLEHARKEELSEAAEITRQLVEELSILPADETTG